MQEIQSGSFLTFDNSIREINEAALEEPKKFVLDTEQAYLQSLEQIAREIAGEEPMCRLVMIAGPSASGKTTTAHLLRDILQKLGVGSESISLDDFYLGTECAPLLPDGRRDFECLEALNLKELHRCLYGLATEGRCDMPIFDFQRRMPSSLKRSVVLNQRSIAVVEGIHALDPVLMEALPATRVRRIYISVKQGVTGRQGEMIGPNDVRLVRRIVRDSIFRSTGPDVTLGMWPDVMTGERKYIKPFRRDADFTINSFHAYELCVLKEKALPLLNTIQSSSPYLRQALRLTDTLRLFNPLSSSLVPADSIIREFIGKAQ